MDHRIAAEILLRALDDIDRKDLSTPGRDAVACQFGMSALANALADSDPQRARALLRESLDLAALHVESTTQLTQGALVAAHLDDARLALELAARAVRFLHWNGDRPQLAGVLNVVAWAATATEPDGAAILQGAARRLVLAAIDDRGTPDSRFSPAASGATEGGIGLISKLRRDATRRLADSLGEARLRERRAEGETIDTRPGRRTRPRSHQPSTRLVT